LPSKRKNYVNLSINKLNKSTSLATGRHTNPATTSPKVHQEIVYPKFSNTQHSVDFDKEIKQALRKIYIYIYIDYPKHINKKHKKL
jgi:hypothetical protein